MSKRSPVNPLWTVAVLMLATAAPLAQDRLTINVREAQRSSSPPNVVHYQGTGSVRHDEQRHSASAQDRRASQGAQGRRESQGAQDRRESQGAQNRRTGGADSRRTGSASDRHGSVRLDTIR
jgi:hypothetical protein